MKKIFFATIQVVIASATAAGIVFSLLFFCFFVFLSKNEFSKISAGFLRSPKPQSERLVFPLIKECRGNGHFNPDSIEFDISLSKEILDRGIETHTNGFEIKTKFPRTFLFSFWGEPNTNLVFYRESLIQEKTHLGFISLSTIAPGNFSYDILKTKPINIMSNSGKKLSMVRFSCCQTKGSSEIGLCYFKDTDGSVIFKTHWNKRDIIADLYESLPIKHYLTLLNSDS